VRRHEFLSGAHEVLRPRSYLEIGVNDGRSLTLSRTRSVAVDPAFRITAEVACDLRLVRATSDDFFARDDALSHFPGGVVDLAFIDGMHLFEFALRDFINTERASTWTSAIVFDDMLPRTNDEAARKRITGEWAGDVYKVIPVLQRYRPDLLCLPLDTAPTGLLLVLGADPTNTVLQDDYDEILAEFVTEDPQDVPVEVRERTGSADPDQVLASDVWSQLVAARDAGATRDLSVYEPLRKLIGTGPTGPITPPDGSPWPPQKKAAPAPAAKPQAASGPPPSGQAARIAAGVRRRAKKSLRQLANKL
jgi:hypothetical protein